MPEFISKLQHKTYEKGEFSDEKARNLPDTLALIKNFPWEEERPLTAVDLTGPSVTIKDEDLNYLKVGLYFNGKYCLYYLDRDNHLYEYYAPDITDVYKKVTDFFNGQLDLSAFEKHFFNIGNQGHFVNKSFIYEVKLWRVVLLSWPFILFFLIFLIFFIAIITTPAPFYVVLVPIIFVLLLGGTLTYIFNKYVKCSAQTLQISKGNNNFSFNDGSGENVYNKNEIKEIIIYKPAGGRNPNDFYVYEIYFKDGSMIKFSNMLISDIVFGNKFPSDLYRYGDKNSFRKL